MAQNYWNLPKPEPFNPIDWGLNFLGTPVYNTANLLADIPAFEPVFGPIRDWEGFSRQEDFKIQHPLSAGAAEFASWLIPAVPYFKATSAVPIFANIAKAGAAAGRPGLGVVGAEIARWAPFSATTVGLNAAADRYENSQEALLDFGLQTAASGIFGAIGPHIPNKGIGSIFHIPAKEWYGVDIQGANTLGKRTSRSLSDELPFTSDIKPYSLQARDITLGVKEGQIPETDAVSELTNIRQRIVQEEVAGGTRYAEFTPTGESSEDRLLEHLYGRRVDGATKAKSYAVPVAAIPGRTSDAIADLTIEGLGSRIDFTPDNPLESWVDFVKYPRIYVAPTKASGMDVVRPPVIETTRFNRALSVIEPGKIWIAREPEDGLWHIVQKIDGQYKKSGNHRMRYLVFKTDSPERFLQRYKDPNRIWKDEAGTPLRLGANAWNGRAGLGLNGGNVFNTTRELVNAIPTQDWRLAMAQKDKQSFTGVVKKAFAQSEVAKRMDSFLDRYVRPGVHQFKHPLAARTYMVMSAVKDNTAKEVKTKIEQIEKMINRLWQEGKGPQIIEHGIRKLTPTEEIPDLEVRALIELLRNEGKNQINEINLTKTVTGHRNEIPLLENHLGISRTYDGDHFIPVRDSGGNVVAIAAGYGKKAAESHASNIVKTYETRGMSGLNWDSNEMFLRDNPQLPREFRIVRGNPGFANPRGNIGGYKWDVEEPTADEFISGLFDNYSARANFQMKMSLEYFLRNDIEKLKELDPHAYDALESRFKALLGEQGAFDKWQNDAVDKILAPHIGKNSATKLAAKITEVNHHMQLGMGNVAYAAMNALSIPIQIPAEVSFLATANLPKLGQAYTFVPTAGADGRLNGIQAIPRVYKAMSDSFKWLTGRRPDKVERVFARAAEDGLYDPQYIEEWSGRMKTALGDWRTATSSGEGFAKWLGAVSNYMGAQTEKLMRSFAIASASSVILSRFPQISDEMLYQYVKRFVGRTAFEYNRYSRPEIFTTPAGQIFGGFKTWQMNYLHMLGDYTAEAGRGNLAPLLWTVMATGSLGGLAALPVLPAVADQASKLLEDKPFLAYLEENFGPTASDALYFGLPSVLTGVSATSNISLPGSHLAHDAEMLFGIAALERAKNMARSLGSVFDAAVIAGVDPMSSPKVQAQIMQGWSPRSFYRVFQTLQDGIDGGSLIAPSTGYPTVEGLGPYSQTMYMLGFNPTDAERQYVVYDMLMKNKELKKQRVSILGEAWAQAQMGQNREAMEMVARRAAAEGVDLSSVLRSANRRMQDMNKDMFGRNFNQEELEKWDNVLDVEE